MAWVEITALLARAPWALEGDLEDKLCVRAALNAQGKLDEHAFSADPSGWTACRTRPGHQPRSGTLVRLDEQWGVCSAGGDDEPIRILVGELFRPGEVVVVRQPDGTELFYRIVAVDTAPSKA